MNAIEQALYDAYAMTDSDRAQLEATLFAEMEIAWVQHMTDLARRHGVEAAPVLRGEERLRIQQKARDDAQSIMDTYNRELEAQITALYSQNPDEDASFFIAALGAWLVRRDEYKSIQIGITSVTAMIRDVFERFYTMNARYMQNQLFIAVGAPPKCPICMKIVADGVVDYQYTRDWWLPSHVNCAHEYIPVNPYVFAPTDDVWVM